MTTPSIMQKISNQINDEFLASQRCLSNSSWCAAQSLNGSAELMREFAQRNITYMARIFNFVKQLGISPFIEQNTPEYPECATLEELFQQMLSDNLRCQDTLIELRQEVIPTNNYEALAFIDFLTREQKHSFKLITTALHEVQRALKEGDDLHKMDARLHALIKENLH